MIQCATLAEALKVPNVIAIVAGNPIKAYQQGDALPPEAVVDNSASVAREGAIDANIAQTTLGGVQPATVAQLKVMSLAEYGAWFDANVTTAAQAIALLRRLTLVIIRRVL